MAHWRDDNKVLSEKIASLEAKLLKALLQEVNSNKSQGQNNGRMELLGLDPSHPLQRISLLYTRRTKIGPLPLPHSRQTPPFKLIVDDSKPRPNYFPSFCHAPAGPWDPLLAHNICNVDRKFKVPSSLPKYFPIMSVKGGPAMVANSYIFSCNNTNQGFKSRYYTCENCSCPVRLNTECWDLVQTIEGEHTFIMPNTTISCLLKWYLVQIMPTSKDLSPTQMAVLACKHLSPTNLKRVPTHTQLVKFVSDRHQASNPMAKIATKIKDLIFTDALKKTEDSEMFLLHDNGQEVKDRIIAYTTTQNLEQLNNLLPGCVTAHLQPAQPYSSSFGSCTGNSMCRLSPCFISPAWCQERGL
ncbi:hypothetical protein DSO57_1006033 [Entomophthora muscae]|uniref:Uncharacterized protein n=1 Tax=Entomophthora muscae TaxID=34485 RepID=A0ACC2T7M7_9FUNG|nr:hypothetical protein DSO57_1006033 [Entomophthora muscae]